MQHHTVLVSSWEDGVRAFCDGVERHELQGESVQALARDDQGRALAIVQGHQLRRRNAEDWELLVESEHDLSCVVQSSAGLIIGTDDARVLRLEESGALVELSDLQQVEGREEWYAGQAVVNGVTVGPPLGVRSMAVTAGGVLLVNVHVGGIVRSEDHGETWYPTIDIHADVHDVCAHPSDADHVIAASASGFCESGDAGLTWHIVAEGLHASYCSAVAFDGDDALVAAAEHHFAPTGAIYRKKTGSGAMLVREECGLPQDLSGIADTRCVDAHEEVQVLVDRGGNVQMAASGAEWSPLATGLASPSSVLILK